MGSEIRVFINERACQLPAGASVWDAVVLTHPDLLVDGAGAGAVLVTDARGLPLPLDAPLTTGSILRVQRSSRRPTHDARG